VIDVPSTAPPSSVRTGDIILGIDGEAVDAKEAVDMLKHPPSVFTLDVERLCIM
jgi:C-terminal processing protease CtpA/Prc